MMRTYQTRLLLDAELTRQLDAYADLYGRAERTLFAEAARGKDLDQLKPGFCGEFGLTARQYNALSRSVKGKIESLLEIRKLRIADLEDHLARLEQVVPKLPPGSLKRHRKRRRMARLAGTLARLKQDRQDGILRLCFGSGKLFHAQHHLEANRYPDHAAWKRDWQDARSDEFFVLGARRQLQFPTDDNYNSPSRGRCVAAGLPSFWALGLASSVGPLREATGCPQSNFR